MLHAARLEVSAALRSYAGIAGISAISLHESIRAPLLMIGIAISPAREKAVTQARSAGYLSRPLATLPYRSIRERWHHAFYDFTGCWRERFLRR